ncbi:MAG TPA: HAD family hydrolase [Candidatus Lustribacter sp.]|nr:HAD family hydrolase [Candidatus Lustribacter sp.]
MATAPHDSPPDVPVEAVIFDVHSTLMDQGDPTRWLAVALARLGRAPDPVAELGPPEAARLAVALDQLWEGAREIDPSSSRDVAPADHRRVFDVLTQSQMGIAADLGGALYETMLDTWQPFEDTVPTLVALRDLGIRIAVLSNVGIDIRGMLERAGVMALVDVAVFSCEVGVVKPDPAIFAHAVEGLGVPAERILMVGDHWADDGAAAALGIRTLILPRTRGPRHGLGLVVAAASSHAY